MANPSPLINPAALNAEAARLSALLASDPKAAKVGAEQILRVAPRDPRALLIVGSAHRRLGDPRAAVSVLQPLAKAYPHARPHRLRTRPRPRCRRARRAGDRRPAPGGRRQTGSGRSLARPRRAAFRAGRSGRSERRLRSSRPRDDQAPGPCARRGCAVRRTLFGGGDHPSRPPHHASARPRGPAPQWPKSTFERGRFIDAETLLESALSMDPSTLGNPLQSRQRPRPATEGGRRSSPPGNSPRAGPDRSGHTQPDGRLPWSGGRDRTVAGALRSPVGRGAWPAEDLAQSRTRIALDRPARGRPPPPTVAASPSPRTSAKPTGASPISRPLPSRPKRRWPWQRC